MKGELADAAGAEADEIRGFLSQIAVGFAEIIRDEDYVMSASQQTSANAGALSEIVFGRNEPALHHYHQTYASKLGFPEPEMIDSIRA